MIIQDTIQIIFSLKFVKLLIDTDRFETIEHYCPIRGHSFLDFNRDFGVIWDVIWEKLTVYTCQYLELII